MDADGQKDRKCYIVKFYFQLLGFFHRFTKEILFDFFGAQLSAVLLTLGLGLSHSREKEIFSTVNRVSLHTASLPLFHCPDMTEILWKRT